ncbi:unnamed protein product [[Candida] boidinii]|nr:unnamed protein product [[Candida] boidinii]
MKYSPSISPIMKYNDPASKMSTISLDGSPKQMVSGKINQNSSNSSSSQPAKKRRRSSQITNKEDLERKKQELKTQHSIIEKKRRIKMNREFEALKFLVPACRFNILNGLSESDSASGSLSFENSNIMHKLTILQSTVEYIKYLHLVIKLLKLQMLLPKATRNPIKKWLKDNDDLKFADFDVNLQDYRNIDKDYKFEDSFIKIWKNNGCTPNDELDEISKEINSLLSQDIENDSNLSPFEEDSNNNNNNNNNNNIHQNRNSTPKFVTPPLDKDSTIVKRESSISPTSNEYRNIMSNQDNNNNSLNQSVHYINNNGNNNGIIRSTVILPQVRRQLPSPLITPELNSSNSSNSILRSNSLNNLNGGYYQNMNRSSSIQSQNQNSPVVTVKYQNLNVSTGNNNNSNTNSVNNNVNSNNNDNNNNAVNNFQFNSSVAARPNLRSNSTNNDEKFKLPLPAIYDSPNNVQQQQQQQQQQQNSTSRQSSLSSNSMYSSSSAAGTGSSAAISNSSTVSSTSTTSSSTPTPTPTPTAEGKELNAINDASKVLLLLKNRTSNIENLLN